MTPVELRQVISDVEHACGVRFARGEGETLVFELLFADDRVLVVEHVPESDDAPERARVSITPESGRPVRVGEVLDAGLLFDFVEALLDANEEVLL